MHSRTNIVLDTTLVKEALHYAKVSTKRELIDLTLREFIANHKRRDIRLLRGKVKLREDYNYKLMRKDKDKDR